ncbi:hypothetical protein HHI36_023667 [Cryptolaemus montrouzieri]|uniref:Uncharacterized protein n=1 Tax=Cryptolaemus montrouzieri TaxID=559131 RepID=A0ABD2PH44_9CUCU
MAGYAWIGIVEIDGVGISTQVEELKEPNVQIIQLIPPVIPSSLSGLSGANIIAKSAETVTESSNQQHTSAKVTSNKSKHKYENNSNANNDANSGQAGEITFAEVNAGINQAMKNIRTSKAIFHRPAFLESNQMSLRKNSVLKSISETTLVHVSGVNPHTSEDDLKQLLKNIMPVSECVKLNSRYPDICSYFKFGIPAHRLGQILKAAIWHKGITVKRFFQKGNGSFRKESK